MLARCRREVLDETDAAIRLAHQAADRSRVRRTGYVSAATLAGLAWVCVERGRWDEALTIANEGSQIAIAGRQEMHIASTPTPSRAPLPRCVATRAPPGRIASVLSSHGPGA